MQKQEKKSRRKKHPMWIIEVDVRALAMLAVTIVMCVLFVISCILFVRGLLRIGRMEIRGMTEYSNEQIINASGVGRGDPLYGISYDEVEQNILRGCPYIAKVEVTGHFPDTLRIAVIEERTPQWYIALADDFYVLDSDLVMLTETATEQELLLAGVTRLILPRLNSVMRGEVPRFGVDETGERDEQLVRRTVEIIDTVRQTSFKKSMTELDVSDITNITFVVDGKYRVELGSNLAELSARLREVEVIVQSESVKNASGGTIYAGSSPAYFRPQ